jgi:heptosyltransferase-2
MPKSSEINKILIIQTAFIGDVILATPIIEFLHQKYPDARIDFILRKGNEGLLKKHPFIGEVFIWDKSKKYKSLLQLAKLCNRRGPYDMLFNLQRFMTTGLMSSLINAREKIGFSKNPMAFIYSRKVDHVIEEGVHEIKRNLKLVEHLGDTSSSRVRLYPDEEDIRSVEYYSIGKYITISPASVWFTKQYPIEKWLELMDQLPDNLKIFLIGGPGDRPLCDQIKTRTKHKDVEVLAGKTNFLETAVLMKKAVLNYSNDSAPLHIASSQNANVCAVFCVQVKRASKMSFGTFPVPMQAAGFTFQIIHLYNSAKI